MRRAEMNELAHLLLNVYAPNFCNDDAKVITVDGVGEKFNTDIGDIAEFVSDAVNVLAGDNYDIARLWYLEAHRKTAYGAMSSRVANKIFANLQAKYKIVEGYPMCDSIPQTQEAIDAMLGILNPTKNKQQVVNEFYDDFRKAFVAVARKAMELIKAYDAKAAAQPSIINKK
jgi:hypothetical protein